MRSQEKRTSKIFNISEHVFFHRNMINFLRQLETHARICRKQALLPRLFLYVSEYYIWRQEAETSR